MLFRTIFANFGKTPRPLNLVRMIETRDGRLMTVQAHAEMKRREAEELARRMPKSQGETYDYSFKVAPSARAEFDFTQ